MDQKLRKILKYGNPYKSADEAIEATRNHLRDLMDDRDINLDMIE